MMCRERTSTALHALRERNLAVHRVQAYRVWSHVADYGASFSTAAGIDEPLTYRVQMQRRLPRSGGRNGGTQWGRSGSLPDLATVRPVSFHVLRSLPLL